MARKNTQTKGRGPSMLKKLLLLVTMLLIPALLGMSCAQLAGDQVEKMIERKDVTGLIMVLEDKNLQSDVRARAALGLGEIGDTRGVEPLIQALQDEDSFLRQMSAVALGNIGDARAIEPLTKALQDEDSHVRQAAAEALEKIEAKQGGG
jgi:HEAT repeat protein